ncbi:MAG: lmo0937 family membrane protein [Cloacibacterium sp.]
MNKYTYFTVTLLIIIWAIGFFFFETTILINILFVLALCILIYEIIKDDINNKE